VNAKFGTMKNYFFEQKFTSEDIQLLGDLGIDVRIILK
jgi:hypothetical protein